MKPEDIELLKYLAEMERLKYLAEMERLKPKTPTSNYHSQLKQLVIDGVDDSDEEIIDMPVTGAHITGHTIAHKSADGKKMQRTNMLVDEVEGKPILIIKKGSTEIKIHAEDWKFFNDRAIELLGKKRLVSKS